LSPQLYSITAAAEERTGHEMPIAPTKRNNALFKQGTIDGTIAVQFSANLEPPITSKFQ
jgi:hypothetical protein